MINLASLGPHPHSGEHPIIRLGHSLDGLRPTLHNGPGWRIGLWTQGCSLRCTRDCLNPHLLDADGGFLYSVDDVANAIVRTAASSYRAEGITVLGGEPTDQIEPLTQLLERVQSAGLTTMVYTGMYLAGLRNRFGQLAEALLRFTDLLVDGPYLASQYSETLPWRGSTNQTIHRISPRYSEEQLERAASIQKKAWSIDIRPGAGGLVNLSASGLQTRAGAAAIENVIRAGETADSNHDVKQFERKDK